MGIRQALLNSPCPFPVEGTTVKDCISSNHCGCENVRVLNEEIEMNIIDPIPRMNLTYIEWNDSRGASNSWREVDEASKDGMCICQSIGWVIKETEQYIQLAPNYGRDPDQVSGDIVIPKSSITMIRYNVELKVKE